MKGRSIRSLTQTHFERRNPAPRGGRKETMSTPDELYLEQPRAYAAEDGTPLATGTGIELARRVHDLEGRLARSEKRCETAEAYIGRCERIAMGLPDGDDAGTYGAWQAAVRRAKEAT